MASSSKAYELYKLGKSYQQERDFDKAIEYYELAIQIDPMLLIARMDLGQLCNFQYLMTSNESLLDKAISELNAVIKLETDDYRRELAKTALRAVEKQK